MASRPSPSKTNVVATLFLAALIATGLASVFLPLAAAAQSTANVRIVDYSFDPGSIVVVIGVNNTVTWSNMGSHTHTVTADDNSFNSGNISPGSSFTHTFTVPGTYSYHCNIHQYMKATIVVESASTTSTSTSTSGGIPEFPYGALTVTAITLLVLVSYLVARQTQKPRNPLP